KHQAADAYRRTLNPPEPLRGGKHVAVDEGCERDIGIWQLTVDGVAVPRFEKGVPRKLVAEAVDERPGHDPDGRRADDPDQDVHRRARSDSWRSSEHARPPTAFEHELDVADRHRLVDGFDHVINRERRYGNGRERFHFHAGLRGRPHARFDIVAAWRGK